MITITDSAIEKFKQSVSKTNLQNVMLRINYGGIGWGGPSLYLTLDELKQERDTVVEEGGIKMVYNSEIKKYIDNVIIDYSDKWYNRGFIIKGANLSSC